MKMPPFIVEIIYLVYIIFTPPRINCLYAITNVDDVYICDNNHLTVDLYILFPLDLKAKGTITGELMTDSTVITTQRKNLTHLDGRDLQTASAWINSDLSFGLEEEPNNNPNQSSNSHSQHNSKSSSNKAWDQFEVNKRLFNVKNTFDENIYTSKLGKSVFMCFLRNNNKLYTLFIRFDNSIIVFT